MNLHHTPAGDLPEGLRAAAALSARPLFPRATRRKLKAAQKELTGFYDTPLPTIGGVPLDLATVGDARRAAGFHRTHDDMVTFDAATRDSLGAFGVNQLEAWDRTLNEPLYDFTWSRDITVRGDVGLGHELASYTQIAYSTPGGITPNGKNWISKVNNVIAGPNVDTGKLAQPLYPWGMELSWSLLELVASQLTGVPIDDAKYRAMQMKWNMDTDAMVYVGDTEQALPTGGAPAGMLNSAAVSATNAVNGASASPLWSSKTPQEILNDVNTTLTAVWTATGYAVTPDQIRTPPAQLARIISTINSTAGSVSIATFLNQNNLSMANNGRALNIQAVKWLTAALRGAGSDRLYAYTNSPRFLRFPMVPLARTPMESRSIEQMVTYYGKLGVVEHRYPETEAYLDGI